MWRKLLKICRRFNKNMFSRQADFGHFWWSKLQKDDKWSLMDHISYIVIFWHVQQGNEVGKIQSQSLRTFGENFHAWFSKMHKNKRSQLVRSIYLVMNSCHLFLNLHKFVCDLKSLSPEIYVYLQIESFQARAKDFSSTAYCFSFVFHCLAYLKCFPLARKRLWSRSRNISTIKQKVVILGTVKQQSSFDSPCVALVCNYQAQLLCSG